MLSKILSFGIAAAMSTATLPEANAASYVAQPSREARDHFEQGAAFYEEGDLQSAAFEFRRAYELSNDHRILYNIAIVDLNLHNYAAAKRSFEQYLSEGGNKLPKDRRAEVKRELRALKARVGTIEVEVNVKGASIILDGKPVGTAPLSEKLQVNLGEHRIEISRPGYLPAERLVQVEGGKRALVIAELERIPQAKPTGTAIDPRADAVDSKRLKTLKTATWSSLAVTGAAGVGAIVAGALALQNEQELKDERTVVPGNPQRLADLQSQTDDLALATDILLGVTVAAAAVSIGVGIVALRESKNRRTKPKKKRSKRKAQAVVRPHGSGLMVRF